MDFAEEDFLLLQGPLDFFFGVAALGHIAEVHSQPPGRWVGVDLEPPVVRGRMEFFQMSGCARAHDLFVHPVKGTADGLGEYFPESAAQDVVAMAHPEALGLLVDADQAPVGVPRKKASVVLSSAQTQRASD